MEFYSFINFPPLIAAVQLNEIEMVKLFLSCEKTDPNIYKIINNSFIKLTI